MQSLWAGPWLTQVGGLDARQQAAQGLFVINLSMLVAFLAWGAVMPRLASAGLRRAAHDRLGPAARAAGLLALIVALGRAAGAWHWALWCVLSTCVSLSQPAVGAGLSRRRWPGRALSALQPGDLRRRVLPAVGHRPG